MSFSPSRLASADPDDQMQFALRTMENAYRQKSAGLEQEISKLRQANKDKQFQVADCETKISDLEHQLREEEKKTRHWVDEHGRMVQENNQLAQTVSRLNRELLKLESFKKSIINSLNDDPNQVVVERSSPLLSATRTTSPYRSRSPPRATSPFRSSVNRSTENIGGDLGGGANDLIAQIDRSINLSRNSTGRSPRSSPTPGGGAIDNKEFFRLAREKLTYEQFNEFLSNIKRLNNHMQTRVETLDKAREIFGPENSELYAAFKSMLSRHGL